MIWLGVPVAHPLCIIRPNRYLSKATAEGGLTHNSDRIKSGAIPLKRVAATSWGSRNCLACQLYLGGLIIIHACPFCHQSRQRPDQPELGGLDQPLGRLVSRCTAKAAFCHRQPPSQKRRSRQPPQLLVGHRRSGPVMCKSLRYVNFWASRRNGQDWCMRQETRQGPRPAAAEFHSCNRFERLEDWPQAVVPRKKKDRNHQKSLATHEQEIGGINRNPCHYIVVHFDALQAAPQPPSVRMCPGQFKYVPQARFRNPRSSSPSTPGPRHIVCTPKASSKNANHEVKRVHAQCVEPKASLAVFENHLDPLSTWDKAWPTIIKPPLESYYRFTMISQSQAKGSVVGTINRGKLNILKINAIMLLPALLLVFHAMASVNALQSLCRRPFQAEKNISLVKKKSDPPYVIFLEFDALLRKGSFIQSHRKFPSSYPGQKHLYYLWVSRLGKMRIGVSDAQFSRCECFASKADTTIPLDTTIYYLVYLIDRGCIFKLYAISTKKSQTLLKPFRSPKTDYNVRDIYKTTEEHRVNAITLLLMELKESVGKKDIRGKGWPKAILVTYLMTLDHPPGPTDAETKLRILDVAFEGLLSIVNHCGPVQKRLRSAAYTAFTKIKEDNRQFLASQGKNPQANDYRSVASLNLLSSCDQSNSDNNFQNHKMILLVLRQEKPMISIDEGVIICLDASGRKTTLLVGREDWLRSRIKPVETPNFTTHITMWCNTIHIPPYMRPWWPQKFVEK
ncbi:hypothetical protein VP01_2495g3 [Puccinia sorghi]|uniref:Uncharacterized protein n=1 Tax=Puccinia sorghi TaxID=27349 RepID=A0A0L6V7L5_9BASI|nr:hypothetical protein VP01_2495g3 [Puccinia sorghi]